MLNYFVLFEQLSHVLKLDDNLHIALLRRYLSVVNVYYLNLVYLYVKVYSIVLFIFYVINENY